MLDSLYSPFGGLIYFGAGDMESLIESSTGMPVGKMKHPIDWLYLEDYDLYVIEHGDTNYSPVKVLYGLGEFAGISSGSDEMTGYVVRAGAVDAVSSGALTGSLRFLLISTAAITTMTIANTEPKKARRLNSIRLLILLCFCCLRRRSLSVIKEAFR